MWTFITNHGLVLIYIARHPKSTARATASALNVTERTVQKIVADLEAEGYIRRRRVGRSNEYHVNSQTPVYYLECWLKSQLANTPKKYPQLDADIVTMIEDIINRES